jgi:hypothetical protein
MGLGLVIGEAPPRYIDWQAGPDARSYSIEALLES